MATLQAAHTITETVSWTVRRFDESPERYPVAVGPEGPPRGAMLAWQTRRECGWSSGWTDKPAARYLADRHVRAGRSPVGKLAAGVLVALVAAAVFLAPSAPALGAMTPDELARMDALEQQVADLTGAHNELVDAYDDLVAQLVPALDAAGAMERCIRSAERVAFHVGSIGGRRERYLVDVPDLIGPRGSFWLPLVHPACIPDARTRSHALAAFAPRLVERLAGGRP